MARLKLSRAASFWLLVSVLAFLQFAASAPSPLYVVYSLLVCCVQDTHHEPRQMVHRHTLGPVWIERGMGEPAKDGLDPATPLHFWQLTAMRG